MRMNAKELIAEARATAPTLPPAAAKLMTAMADRLNVQFVALCESRSEAKQLAGENAVMKSAIKTHSESVHFCVGCGQDDPCSNDDICHVLEETPATDAFLANQCAEAVDSAVGLLRILFNHQAPVLENVTNALQAFAAQLRCKSVAPSEIDQPPVRAAITALPVERNQYGYWTHPVYEEFCDGREYISNEDFNVWMKDNGLEWKVDYRDEEALDPEVDGYDLSTWQPEAPAGEGWFVGSIHDTDDGAVCIWLRNKSEPSPETVAIARQFEQLKEAEK